MIRLPWKCKTVLFIAFVLGCWRSLDAAEITYSWSGSMRLFDNLSPDPWGIGADGAQFTISTTADMGAIDRNSTQAPFADFSATNARLSIDGDQISYVEAASIDFADFTNNLDVITMGGVFTKGGQS